MVKRRIQLTEDVVQMARTRVKNVFANGLPVYLGMSGGKDSIVLAHVVYTLIREGEVDASQLTVDFIDEEAMHEEVIRVTKDWRKRFLKVGADFRWWCIEVKHFNCFNALSQDETFICWDSRVPDRWVRERPSFALTGHPQLRPQRDSYQDFLPRICAGGITITGVRVAESVQRLSAFRERPNDMRMQKPVYDWRDTDVWRYIQENELDFPETYLHLYQTGSSKRDMRLSQFFSIDTARALVRLGEYDHGLMDRVSKREPNAYLAALYWDSEMFRSGGQSKKSSSREKGDESAESQESAAHDLASWRARAFALLNSEKYLGVEGNPVKLARNTRTLIMRLGGLLTEADWREIVYLLEGGDPKFRGLRAFAQNAWKRHTKDGT